MARFKSESFRTLAERRFQYKVDIEMPARGFGQSLNAMYDWCREKVEPDNWAGHGWREKLIPGQIQCDYMRFYFSDRATAMSFIDVWEGTLQED